LWIITLFVLTLSDALAINAPSNLKIDSIENTSVNLSWDTSSGAYMYYISYWLNAGWSYDNQTDFIDSNTWVINWLETWKTYYFVVTALDENWDESSYSNEIAWDTWVNIFSLESIVVNTSNSLELNFSRDLDTTENTEREFKIYNKSDNLDTFDVISTEIDSTNPNNLIVTLDRELQLWVEYELVVIAIKDINLNNIESWIDSIESFIFNNEIINTTESWGIITESWVLDENNEELNSANSDSWTVDNSTWTVVINEWPSWSNIDTNELNNTTLGAAWNTNQLPKTWPENILILVLSIILWALVFVFKYKKA